jgi:hypothetical protein
MKIRREYFQKDLEKYRSWTLSHQEILSLTGITITEHGTVGEGVIFDMVIPAGSYRVQEQQRPSE